MVLNPNWKKNWKKELKKNLFYINKQLLIDSKINILICKQFFYCKQNKYNYFVYNWNYSNYNNYN